MRRTGAIVITALLLAAGCAYSGLDGQPGTESNESALELQPRLEVVGLERLPEGLDISRLVLHISDLALYRQDELVDTVPVLLTWEASGATSTVLARPIRLPEAGRYHAELTLAPCTKDGPLSSACPVADSTLLLQGNLEAELPAIRPAHSSERVELQGSRTSHDNPVPQPVHPQGRGEPGDQGDDPDGEDGGDSDSDLPLYRWDGSMSLDLGWLSFGDGAMDLLLQLDLSLLADVVLGKVFSKDQPDSLPFVFERGGLLITATVAPTCDCPVPLDHGRIHMTAHHLSQ